MVERILPVRTPKKRMLVIVNPYATTVSDRLKNLVLYALQGRYAVEAVETEARGHATQLCREAASEGYDVVAAFGGDGTVNEAANGLVGSDTPLTALPGGATNVFCRTVGIPADVVDATEHLLRKADEFRPERIDVGLVNGRAFVFASGIGLDASVVERVDSRPRLKARLGEYYFTYAGLATFARRYLVNPPHVLLEGPDGLVEGVSVIVQNSDPYTYFGAHPIRICEGAGFRTGTLSLTMLTRATVLEFPTLLPRIFSGRAHVVQRHRRIVGYQGLETARVTALENRSFPLEVDGDYLGEADEAHYGVSPLALSILA
jgi:diacylglycerol kinase family enzyme